MAKNKSKHIKKENHKKQHYNKSYIKIAFIIVFILCLILILNLLKNKPTSTNYDDTQIILNNSNITSELENKIQIENNKIYMSYNDLQKFIDKTIYQEENTDLIITASNKKIATLKKDEDKITINGATQKIKDVVIEKAEVKYIAISELANVYDYDIEHKKTTNIVTIDNLDKKLVKAYAKKNINVKSENKSSAKIIEKVEKGRWLIFINEENGVAKVRTQNGNIGYVNKNLLDNFITEREDFGEEISKFSEEESKEYNIFEKDISTFEKRLNTINLILQETIKNDKMCVKIIYKGTENFEFERFKIEAVPMLRECGIKVEI